MVSVMTLMCVCLRGSIHVFKKRNDITVWLQIVKKIKNMDPTIYMRQDLDHQKVVKYCFLQVQPVVELSRDELCGNLPKSILLSSCLNCFVTNLDNN